MNIAVIFGGESCEHDISIITGLQLVSKCNEYLYNIIPIYIDKNGTWLTGKNLKDIDNFSNNLGKTYKCGFLPNDANLYIEKKFGLKKYQNIDLAFVCLHGLRGEDGSVASILELSKIPYSSSSNLASSICLDKSVFKTVCQGLNVNVIDGISIQEKEYLTDKDDIINRIEILGYPIIIKPSRQGSSIGIEICENKEALETSLKKAFEYDKKLLIEKFVKIKKEINIALFDNKGEILFSNTEEPISKDKILSFDEKYRKNAGGFETIKRIIPADIGSDMLDSLKSMAEKLYTSLEMFGIVRFDFILDEEDNLYVNEVNTIPGSMANYLFDKEKYSYANLIELMITNAIFRKSQQNEVKKIFDTDVLNNGFEGFKK